MIFSVQHYVEDYFHRRNLSDVDQYAVHIANCFADSTDETEGQLLKSIHRIRTTFYRNNPHLDRIEFESSLIRLLRARYKKKVRISEFPGGIREEQYLLRTKRRTTIQFITRGFALAVEARAVDSFWESRTQGRLRSRAEKIGQSLFVLFAKGVLAHHRTAVVLREMFSGVGFVDVGVTIGGRIHLVEMKLLRSGFTGASQLDAYMRTEARQRGWLICFDARPPSKRDTIPLSIGTPSGMITVIPIDINPITPSRRA